METQQPDFTVEELEIVPLPEREAMGKIKVGGPANNNLSPRGRNSWIGILVDIF